MDDCVHPNAGAACKSLYVFYIFPPLSVSNLYTVPLHIPAIQPRVCASPAQLLSSFTLQREAPDLDAAEHQWHTGAANMDIVLVGIGLAFFVLMFGYISACENL